MKRIVLAATVLVAGLSAVPGAARAAAGAPAIEAPCQVTAVNPPDPVISNTRFLLTATPPSPDPTQPLVTTECSLEWLQPSTEDLVPIASWEQTVGGPTGFLADRIRLDEEDKNGSIYYLCTRAWTSPVHVEAHYGCAFAFSW